MGFFSSLAKKVSSGVSTLGKKVVSGVRAGVKYGITHSEKISDIAGKVGDVAGKIGDVAGVGATITAGMGLEPVAGFLGGVAGVSKGVSKGAGAVKGVADRVTQAKEQLGKFGIDANQMANRFL